MSDASILEINLTALASNMRVVRSIVGPSCDLCPVIKADAYGLGAGRIGRHLATSGARMLAVYTPEQAADLLRQGVSGDVLVLMPLRQVSRSEELYRGLVTGRLHLTGHGVAHIETLVELADRFGVRIPIHLEVDTGMHRGGCPADEATDVLERITSHPRLHLAGLFTHFVSSSIASESVRAQIERFDVFLEGAESFIPDDCVIHQAATLTSLQDDRLHRSMVRFGLGWAGYGPELLPANACVPESFDLRPILTWSSSVIQVRDIEAGERIGYGGRWTTTRATRLGLVPVGYADGYPTSLAGTDQDGIRASVAVLEHTQRAVIRHDAPVVGAVSMDQITIDLTDLPWSDVGTEIELITPDREAPNHLPALAQAAEVLPHEMMCRLNPRIRRVYRSNPIEIETMETTTTAAAG